MPSCISSQALLTLGNPSLRPSDQDPSVAPEKGRRKTTHANTNDKTKPHKPLRRKLTRPAYTLPQIASLRAKIFSPTFKPPRPGRIPNPPSLAGSRLPPPCAEIDERPRVRRRRFKLWKDNVVELRVAVLNPRKRGERNAMLHSIPTQSLNMWVLILTKRPTEAVSPLRCAFYTVPPEGYNGRIVMVGFVPSLN